ncbi:unnamed protein product [Cyprideis torosa]|uniref:Uncharacterized protein n=1 Tax=Cyprideis torosa TaxID=163714 RepID=A0A7R8ZPP6_9CRUS|nr:unnamed protein product [Cyprideis torosa]CAG0888782.1 unnamed protein product [Cyprideis torosa]
MTTTAYFPRAKRIHKHGYRVGISLLIFTCAYVLCVVVSEHSGFNHELKNTYSQQARLGQRRLFQSPSKAEVSFTPSSGSSLGEASSTFTSGRRTSPASPITSTLQDGVPTTTENLLPGINCTHPSIEDFPADFMRPEQRNRGGAIAHFLIACYLLIAIAIVCDEYFVPSLEYICQDLKLPTDVAGATFMAAGSSAPELFTNIVGTFITEGDIGVGTIVGSAVFNIMGVVAICGILVPREIPIDFWSLTRDCLAYTITVITLILVITDEEVQWYEALIMVLLYLLYIVVMYFNSNIEDYLIKFFTSRGIDPKRLHLNRAMNMIHTPLSPRSRSNSRVEDYDEVFCRSSSSDKDSFVNHSTHLAIPGADSRGQGYETFPPSIEVHDTELLGDDDVPTLRSFFSFPSCERSRLYRIYWCISWPIRLLQFLTIPDCRKDVFKRWYLLTFVMCIAWIGGLSYFITWMITIVGYTLGVPDSVMGITILAAGTSLPEIISSVIVARQGYGSMSISNCVGSNTFDILICLGIPWLIKGAMIGVDGRVFIQSTGIEFSVIALLTTVVAMYLAMFSTGFFLDKRVGYICLTFYALFLIISTLFELNVFKPVNLPMCSTTA